MLEQYIAYKTVNETKGSYIDVDPAREIIL